MLDEIAYDERNSNLKELQVFLYILMRDHLPSGTVHQILIDHTSFGEANMETVYSNPFLAADALKCAEAILSHSTFKKVLESTNRKSLEKQIQVERANDTLGW